LDTAENPKQNPMLFGPDFKSFLFDFYHSFGCFFSIEDGLYRSPSEEKIAKYIFPKLHSMTNNSVATKLTNALRQHSAPELKRQQ
jgi:hypothetical protein